MEPETLEGRQHEGIQEEHHTTTKAETGMMILQPQESQRLPADPQKLGKKNGKDSSSQIPEGTNLANSSILDF